MIIGSEQGGIRPAVILQNDIGNKYSPTTIVAPMTTKSKTYVPMHVRLKESFLAKRSTLLLEQIRTIDKRRLIKKMGSLSEKSMAEIAKLLDKNFVTIQNDKKLYTCTKELLKYRIAGMQMIEIQIGQTLCSPEALKTPLKNQVRQNVQPSTGRGIAKFR